MRSPCAALALTALLALAGCGGSSSKPATTTAATTTPEQSVPLHASQLRRVDRGTQGVLSATPLFQSALNACVTKKHRSGCVRRAARPAEAAVARARKTLTSYEPKARGACQSALSSQSETLATLTDDLRSMTQATLQGSFTVTTRLGASVTTDLRSFAQAGQGVAQVCAA